MKREIKFRGFEYNNKVIYGFSDLHVNRNGEICVMVGGRGFVPIDKLKNITQFTGLKDKNGKEIYEGDIINCIIPFNTLKNQIVEFRNNQSAFVLSQYGTKLHDVRKIEVIGNIYENPELLNNKK